MKTMEDDFNEKISILEGENTLLKQRLWNNPENPEIYLTIEERINALEMAMSFMLGM